MELKEIMQYQNFVVLGNTINEEKYAYKIKNTLEKNGYLVAGVPKEIKTLEEVPFEIDVLDLCINSSLGIEILKNTKKQYKCVVIQPGAESEEILSFLKEKNIPFLQGCLLVGCSLFSKNKQNISN